MVESYKYKSKLTTAISFLSAFIVYIGKDELATVLPDELAYLAPIIVLLAGYIATQFTENKRVDIAEQLVHEEYDDTAKNKEDITVNLTLDGEDIVSDDSDSDEDGEDIGGDEP